MRQHFNLLTGTMNTECVIFDLDGTLMDTAGDLASACNYTLEKYGFRKVSESQLQTRAAAGMTAMLKLGVPETEFGRAGLESSMRSCFAARYREQICLRTRPFKGICELLCLLHSRGLRLAVASSKYEELAVKLLSEFSFFPWFCLVLGGDSLPHGKPHPEPLLRAMNAAGCTPQTSIYAGDHPNDIKAAQAAGCRSCAVLWGYGSEAELRAANADILLKHPLELLNFL